MVEKVAGVGDSVAHVKLGTEPRDVPAGPRQVSVLKAELGVDPADTLFEKVKGRRVPLADDQVVDVESGMHFEAIRGGGVS
jgi:hypothetical protein